MKTLPTVNLYVQDVFGANPSYAIREVEVLTVNFNSGSMRVRYIPKDYHGKHNYKMTLDTSNKEFRDKYQLVDQLKLKIDTCLEIVKQ